jgi:hypothetical protein
MDTTTTQPTSNARTVAGLMGFVVLFALIGNEVQIAQGNKPQKLSSGLDKGATIMIGGTIATGLLIATSGAGDAGRKFSVGLATVAAVTAALVYGAPVWQAISGIVGGKATTPTGSTGASTPTQGTAMTTALAQGVGAAAG